MHDGDGPERERSRWTARQTRSGSRCRSDEVATTATTMSTPMVPRPTHAVSYPDVNGTTAEITSILTKDSPTAVATCTARKTEAPRARDRCRPMTTAERIPRGRSAGGGEQPEHEHDGEHGRARDAGRPRDEPQDLVHAAFPG